MARFEHLRHKPPTELAQPRQLVVACAPMRSQVNFSRIIRMAGCCGVQRVIGCGTAKAIQKIARDADGITVEIRRTLGPVLANLREEGYEIVGLEQTTNSENLHTLEFSRRTALVVGNERNGLSPEDLALVDRVAEIPVWGKPLSYNAATAACLALYEYCRQFPAG